jgi:osmotically-inducible protein OsmY
MRRGQPQGPASDQDVEEFIYDALELLPGAGDVEVRCDGGRVSLAGSVPHRRVKHDVGEVAWAIPGINDVNNTITITARRRSRSFNRESETPQPGGQGRKQS